MVIFIYRRRSLYSFFYDKSESCNKYQKQFNELIILSYLQKLCTCRGCGFHKKLVSQVLKSKSTGTSRMISAAAEGCHVAYSGEFVGTVYCTCGQWNTTNINCELIRQSWIGHQDQIAETVNFTLTSDRFKNWRKSNLSGSFNSFHKASKQCWQQVFAYDTQTPLPLHVQKCWVFWLLETDYIEMNFSSNLLAKCL